MPLAFIAAFIADFPLHWILYATLSGGDNPFITPYPKTPEIILSPFVHGLVLVWISAQVVPSKKMNVAYILYGAWIFISLGSYILLKLGVFDSFPIKLVENIWTVIAGILGCHIGVFAIRTQLQKEISNLEEEDI